MPASPAPTLAPRPAEPVSLLDGADDASSAHAPAEPPVRLRTLSYGAPQAGDRDPAPAEDAAAPAGDAAAPRRIGDYLVRRLLGEGGMGRVYEAEERLSKRRVALKVLRSELARSEAGRRQFVQEMGILASLDDPHIVRCLHCTEVDGELVMALEHLDGQTLRAHLLASRDGPGGPGLPWDEVVDIAWQIASALAAAHGASTAIIHRDLKPENVMLLPGGRVKVMDFGIAKVVQAASGATTHSLGTLQYMSPEQIDARPLDARADLYALGLVMWELLVGAPPFVAESPRVLLDKLCTEVAPPLPPAARRGLPRGLEQLVAQLLEKDPADRPADAAEVRARLDPLRPAEREPTPGSRPVVVRPNPNTDAAGSAASLPAAPALDTIAMVERAAGPRELSARLAALIIVVASLLAGLATWLVRLSTT